MIDNSPNRQELFLEDFEVGQVIKTQSETLTAESIIAFARIYDPQPFHTDPEAAKKTIFAGLVASGWHTAAVTMSLMVKSGVRVAGGFIGLGAEVAWPMPTRPGDELTVEIEIVEVKPSKSNPARGTVTIHCRTQNQKNETVQNMKSRIIVPRKPATG